MKRMTWFIGLLLTVCLLAAVTALVLTLAGCPAVFAADAPAEEIHIRTAADLVELGLSGSENAAGISEVCACPRTTRLVISPFLKVKTRSVRITGLGAGVVDTRDSEGIVCLRLDERKEILRLSDELGLLFGVN